MQGRWVWTFLVVVVLAALAKYAGLADKLHARISTLASQPGVSMAFQDPESGRTDALTTLIGVAVLTPLAALAAVIVVVLVAKAFEAVVVSVRLPAWLSTPVVGMVAIFAIYATSPAWLPASLHGLGLVARAYIVYTGNPTPIIR